MAARQNFEDGKRLACRFHGERASNRIMKKINLSKGFSLGFGGGILS
jgi:hypothetical protein